MSPKMNNRQSLKLAPSENEQLYIYPAEESEERLGVVEHHYDSRSPQNDVAYDVVGLNIVEAKFPDEDAPNDEVLDEFRRECRRFVRRVLLTHDHLSFVETTVSREAKHRYRIYEHSDENVYVVELQTENRRRIK